MWPALSYTVIPQLQHKGWRWQNRHLEVLWVRYDEGRGDNPGVPRAMMQRRSFLASAAALSLGAARPRHAWGQEAGEFSRSVVLDRARKLATEPFKAPDPLPDALTALSAEDYASIRFRDDRRFFADPPTGFGVELVHPGFVYALPVEIFLIEDGQPRAVAYDPDLYSFGNVVPRRLTPFRPALPVSGYCLRSTSPTP